MEFKTVILSENHGISRYFEKVAEDYLDLMVVKSGTFIFKRPDNGKVIIEIDGSLYEEDENDVFALSTESIEHFKLIIKSRYKEEIIILIKGVSELARQAVAKEHKTQELESEIGRLEGINEVDFSETRLRSIQQQSKNLRNHKRKLTNIKTNMESLILNIQSYKLAEEHSLRLLNELL